MCEEMGIMAWAGMASIDARSYSQYFMNSYTGRLQAYAENFDTRRGRYTTEYELTNIDKVPVYVLNAENDGDCEDPGPFL